MQYSPFFLLCFFAIQTILVHGCFQSEREALLEFKAGVSDPSGILVSWRGEECCKWAGIKCSNQTGHVVKLNPSTSYPPQENQVVCRIFERVGRRCDDGWSNHILSGEISPSLLALTDLKHLDLSFNNFTGNIFPKFICSFRNLKYLNLYDTGLSGIIPSQLSNLSRLQYLSLGNSYSFTDHLFISNMGWLSHLTSLKYIYMEGVNLHDAKEWIEALSMLPSLQSLHLSENNLTTIPSSLLTLNFSSLTNFSLSDNNFNSPIPNWVSNITSLTELSLFECSFVGQIPNTFGNLISLNTLWLSDIYLEGPIPLLHNLHNLTSITLDYININEEITELLNKLSNETLKNLEYLSLSNTRLTGDLTGWLHKMTNLKSLWLDMNKINGTIPAKIGDLNLDELVLHGNSLSGEMPAQIWNLTNLVRLDLSGNSFKGQIPAEIGNLSNLDRLDLSKNSFRGKIPAEIGSLTNLVYLDLSKNSFVGGISEIHLTGLSKLLFLDLSNNSIIIIVNHDWIAPFQLIYLAASDCKLGPGFPSWIQYQNKLYYLDLSGTRIVDNLPDWFWNLSSLSYIELSHNNITGRLPHSLPNTIQVINLASNNFAGTIPSSISNLDRLTVLQLSDNNLNGELSSSIQFCKNLIVIDLGENQFYGEIPKWLGESLPNLTVLRLRSNSFSGNIPSQITQLDSLQILDLSDNNISGLIPQNIDMLKAMALPDHDNMSNSALSKFLSYNSDYYSLSVSVSMKDLNLEYSTSIIPHLRSIDLSRNNLMDEIPQSITALLGLRNLNLSYNNLNGTIPKEIGNMQSLESLDFRLNKLSGIIPYSLANLNFLATLNLSHNNLSGEIPTGNQLQTLSDPYIYAGNPYLCGSQINISCNTGDISHDFTINDDDSNNMDKVLLYLFMVLGFGFGFWMVFGILIFKRNWRYYFFLNVDDISDRIYVFVMVRLARFREDPGK